MWTNTQALKCIKGKLSKFNVQLKLYLFVVKASGANPVFLQLHLKQNGYLRYAVQKTKAGRWKQDWSSEVLGNFLVNTFHQVTTKLYLASVEKHFEILVISIHMSNQI